MEVGFKTDKGVSRSNNEDACFVMLKDKVFIIADGVGGNKSGEIASRTAVNGMAKYVEDHPMDDLKSLRRIREYFEQSIKDVNFQVLENSQRFEENKGMATTLVVASLIKNKLCVFNVGDSRAYIYRNKEMTQITEDHTYVNTLVKAGVISRDEAVNHEKKNMITRAVGADYLVEPDFFAVTVKAEDIILLCTDGLYDEVTNDAIQLKLEEHLSMTATCVDLIEMANKNGGHDNITMICLRITEDDIDE